MERRWFHLVDEQGNLIASSTSVHVDREDVDTFRKAVKKEFPNILSGIAAAELTVFANGVALESQASITPFGGENSVELIVRVPKKEQLVSVWLVRGSIANAAAQNSGVRNQLYRSAGANLGCYDPKLCTDGERKAFWYEDDSLRIHVLFKEERDAMRFAYCLEEATVIFGSALYGRDVHTEKTTEVVASDGLQYISLKDYVASDSSEASVSSCCSTISMVDVVSDEFKYQGIESPVMLGSLGKADSCLVMSAAYCRANPEFHEFACDPSNRLYLSQDLHGFFDGSNVAVAVMIVRFESVSPAPVIEDRYEVKVIIKALDAEYGGIIAARLKDGATVSTDGQEMKTTVFVKNPERFRQCLEWKAEQTEASWSSYYDMTPAVD